MFAKQKILKDRELELLTDVNSKVKHYQCPDKDCGAQYNRSSDVFDQISDSKVVPIGSGRKLPTTSCWPSHHCLLLIGKPHSRVGFGTQQTGGHGAQ